MTKQEEPVIQQPSTPDQQYQQMFTQLSAQFKTPLRNILGETQEAVQNTVSTMIQQLIQVHLALKESNKEVVRLQKLCTDNKINFNHIPNRAQRRAKEQIQKKTNKKALKQS